MLGDRNILRPDRSSALDELAKDAPERATGHLGDPGFFDAWQKVATFDVDAQGLRAPFAVEVVAEKAIFDTDADALSVGLLWDDATIKETGPVDIQAHGAGESPGSAILRVSAVRGRKLEVWTSGFDKFGSARVVTAQEAVAIEEKKGEEAKKPPGEDLVEKVIIAAAVVLALYLGATLLLKRIG